MYLFFKKIIGLAEHSDGFEGKASEAVSHLKN
jgi:hypothetical protein